MNPQRRVSVMMCELSVSTHDVADRARHSLAGFSNSFGRMLRGNPPPIHVTEDGIDVFVEAGRLEVDDTVPINRERSWQ